jgi:hypothetical protein
MVQKQLIRSKDATVAFFYRTFSPTYRISRMYYESWFNGSQRRGLERIQKSFVQGNAFALVKGATTHMKDVWKQVMEAYKVKAAKAKVEKARRMSAVAAAKAAKGQRPAIESSEASSKSTKTTKETEQPHGSNSNSKHPK